MQLAASATVNAGERAELLPTSAESSCLRTIGLDSSVSSVVLQVIHLVMFGVDS
jgi:hypothetical protein